TIFVAIAKRPGLDLPGALAQHFFDKLVLHYAEHYNQHFQAQWIERQDTPLASSFGGCFGGGAANRSTFEIVGFQQGWRGLSFENRRELPGEIMHVLHAGIRTLTTPG